MVNKALDSEPTAINVSESPKPAAAPNASNKGLIGIPCESSGPLAQKTPTSAMNTPTKATVESASPVANAYARGTTALIELIGATTPIRPVDNPSYKHASPMYPAKPARAPGIKYPSKPRTFPCQLPEMTKINKPTNNPIT